MQEILGRERRRRWSDEDRERIVAESSQPGVSVSWVARCHGLSPSQLFAWRKAAKQMSEATAPVSSLIPVEVLLTKGAPVAGDKGEPAVLARAQIVFPNGRHLFVPAGLERRLLDELIGAVAAS